MKESISKSYYYFIHIQVATKDNKALYLKFFKVSFWEKLGSKSFFSQTFGGLRAVTTDPYKQNNVDTISSIL